MKLMKKLLLVVQILLTILVYSNIVFAYDLSGSEFDANGDSARNLTSDSENLNDNAPQPYLLGQTKYSNETNDSSQNEQSSDESIDYQPSNSPINKGWLVLASVGALATLPVLLCQGPIPYKKTGSELFPFDFVHSDNSSKTLKYYIHDSAKPYTKDIKSGVGQWQKASGVKFHLINNPNEAQIIYNASSSTDPNAVDSNGFPMSLGEIGGSDVKDISGVTRTFMGQSSVTLNPLSDDLKNKNPTFSAAQLVAHETGHSLGLADLYERGTEKNIMFGSGSNEKTGPITKEQGNIVKTLQTVGAKGLTPGSYGVRDQDGYNDTEGKAIYKDPNLLPDSYSETA